MIYLAIGIVVLVFSIIGFLIWIALRDPESCPKCGSEVVVWDYDRIVCSNPKCDWGSK